MLAGLFYGIALFWSLVLAGTGGGSRAARGTRIG